MVKKLQQAPSTGPITTAVSGATIATVNVIGLVANWSAELIAGVNIAAAAWVGVAGLVVNALRRER